MESFGCWLTPLELLNKMRPLTDAETTLLQSHTTQGQELLQSSKDLFSGAAEVALCHHENVDGSGYPNGKEGDNIPLFARIISIADAYDCMTTRKINNKVMSPSEALDVLYTQRGNRFDKELVIKFIDGIGIFPPGSIVEMTNGEVGIVLSSNQDKLKPQVIMILDSVKEAAIQQVLNLSSMAMDAAGSLYQIKTTLCDGTFGIYVGDFQRGGLRIG